MIQRLRRRFTMLSMSALFVVLALIFIGINVLSFISVVEEADRTLELISGNKGHFPHADIPISKPFPQFSPEAPYETRYFSVLLSENGEVILAETESIAAVNTDQAIELAQRILTKRSDTGFYGDYRYNRHLEEDGTRVVFLDCSRSLGAFRNFLYVSILISVCCFSVVLLIIWLLSPRIIRPLAQNYEKQKRFITDAGHELKTPLTIIAADADVLEMEMGKNEWLEDIKKQTKHLAALTNDLVFLARLEESNSAVSMPEFPISDVVEEEVASFQALALAQNKRLDIRIEPMLPCRANEKNVRQLVGILLDNALKYSPDQSTVTVALEKLGKSLRLSCTNRCANPLTQQDAQHLFDRFFRSDPSRNSKTGGFGLGLSIAHAIMNAHGGKLMCQVKDDMLTVTAVFNS